MWFRAYRLGSGASGADKSRRDTSAPAACTRSPPSAPAPEQGRCTMLCWAQRARQCGRRAHDPWRTGDAAGSTVVTVAGIFENRVVRTCCATASLDSPLSGVYLKPAVSSAAMARTVLELCTAATRAVNGVSMFPQVQVGAREHRESNRSVDISLAPAPQLDSRVSVGLCSLSRTGVDRAHAEAGAEDGGGAEERHGGRRWESGEEGGRTTRRGVQASSCSDDDGEHHRRTCQVASADGWTSLPRVPSCQPGRHGVHVVGVIRPSCRRQLTRS